jgi:hypothetical protein
MCKGQGGIDVPRNAHGGESIWLVRPFALRDIPSRDAIWCPFCEVDHPGLARADEVAAFILRFGDAQWITHIDFNEFMGDLGAARNR